MQHNAIAELLLENRTGNEVWDTISSGSKTRSSVLQLKRTVTDLLSSPQQALPPGFRILLRLLPRPPLRCRTG